jgi:nucleoside-diphosphate-sugar epimerase
MKHVLVTGSSGFIAPGVIRSCLKKKWKVYGVDIKKPKKKISKVKYFQKNVVNLDLKFLKKIDYVAHMAFKTNIPKSILNPISYTKKNIEMTAILLEKCTNAGVKKFIFPSTASQYGSNKTPWKEDMQADPFEPYSWQKNACENLLKMWNKQYGLKTCTLILFQIFGENPRPDTALAKFFKAKKNKKLITLTSTTAQSSFRTGVRDFVHINDVGEAFVKAMLSRKVGKGEIINIASGKKVSMEQVANTIGGKIKFIPKRKFEVDVHHACVSKAKKLLDWKYKIDILKWIKEVLKYQT